MGQALHWNCSYDAEQDGTAQRSSAEDKRTAAQVISALMEESWVGAVGSWGIYTSLC